MSIFDSLKSLTSMSPNTEMWLGAIPSILGNYEMARGRPLGSIIGGLGDILSQHAGLRRDSESANALFNLTSSIDPKSSPIAYKRLQALQPQLSSLDPKDLTAEVKNIQGLSDREQLDAAKYRPPTLHYLKDGTPVLANPNAPFGQQFKDPQTGQPISTADIAKHNLQQPKTGDQAFIQSYLQDHPGDMKGLAEATQARKLQGQMDDARYHAQLSLNNSMIEARYHSKLALGNEVAMSGINEARNLDQLRKELKIRDENMTPEQLLGPNVAIDNNTLTKKQFNNAAEVKAAQHRGEISVIAKPDLANIARMKNINDLLDALDKAGDAVLPKASNSPIDTYMYNELNKLTFGYLTRSGNTEATKFGSIPNLLLAELNPILTGSPRAMAASEFNRFLGEGNKLSSKSNPFLEKSDIEALVPKPGDTKEQKNVKVALIRQITKDRYNTMGLKIPEPEAPSSLLTPLPTSGGDKF